MGACPCKYSLHSLHCPRPGPRERPIELGFMIMFGSVYTESRLRLMQISIGSVHIQSVSVSVSGSVNNRYNLSYVHTHCSLDVGSFNVWEPAVSIHRILSTDGCVTSLTVWCMHYPAVDLILLTGMWLCL